MAHPESKHGVDKENKLIEPTEAAFRENAAQYRRRKISHYVVYYTITISSLFYNLLLLSLWPYLNKLDSNADKQFLGYLAAIGAIGTTLFCPLFGKWSNNLKSARAPFLITLVCGLLNYSIYVMLPLMPIENRRFWFLVSRLMTGMNDVNIGLARGYIAESTLKHERRQAISLLTGLQTMAAACGPILQALMGPLQESGYSFMGGYIKIDMYTSIGWLGLIAVAINILLFAPYIFQHCDMRHAEQSPSVGNTSNLNQYYKLMAWTFILLQFWLTCNYLFLRILGTPLVMDEYAMNRPDALQFNSYIATSSAIVSLIAILILDVSCQKMGEDNVMYIGFVIIIIGRFVMYPLGENIIQNAANSTELGCPQWSQVWCEDETQMYKSQFVLSNVLDNFGFSWTITLIYTKFSQVLETKQQGTWMGFMTSFSGLARIVSPIVLSAVYASMGNAMTVLITNFVFMFLIWVTLWAIIYWTRRGSLATREKMNDLNRNADCELIERNDTDNKCIKA